MRGPASRPIVIAAGGTGGHFFPAEALASTLVERGHRVVLMTDARSGAASSTVFAGRERYILHGAGLAGRGIWRGASAALALARGTLQARRLLGDLNASALVGFGGYPSVAPVLAARSLRNRPQIILQEQNAVLGRANRFLCRRADILALGFSETKKVPLASRTVVTGNPVRAPIEAFAGLPLCQDDGSFNLLVLGGSLGARVFSDVVPAAIARMPQILRARLRVTQQCRAEDLSRVGAAYAEAGVAAELSPFFADVAARLSAAHLVVARAGASTCAELSVIGRPSILVPLPAAIDDHQRANAEALALAGGAVLCLQQDFSPGFLSERLAEALSNPQGLEAAALASAACGRPGATRELADIVERVLMQAEAAS